MICKGAFKLKLIDAKSKLNVLYVQSCIWSYI